MVNPSEPSRSRPTHVDADLVEPDAVRGQPLRGEPAQPHALCPARPRPAACRTGSRPGLTSQTTNVWRVHRDDVDLTVGTSPVPVQDAESAALQVADRRLFAFLAEQVFAPTAITSAFDDGARLWVIRLEFADGGQIVNNQELWKTTPNVAGG